MWCRGVEFADGRCTRACFVNEARDLPAIFLGGRFLPENLEARDFGAKYFRSLARQISQPHAFPFENFSTTSSLANIIGQHHWSTLLCSGFCCLLAALAASASAYATHPEIQSRVYKKCEISRGKRNESTSKQFSSAPAPEPWFPDWQTSGTWYLFHKSKILGPRFVTYGQIYIEDAFWFDFISLLTILSMFLSFWEKVFKSILFIPSLPLSLSRSVLPSAQFPRKFSPRIARKINLNSFYS